MHDTNARKAKECQRNDPHVDTNRESTTTNLIKRCGGQNFMSWIASINNLVDVKQYICDGYYS